MRSASTVILLSLVALSACGRALCAVEPPPQCESQPTNPLHSAIARHGIIAKREGMTPLLPEIRPICVENPFSSPKAIPAFQNYIAKLILTYGKNIPVPDSFWSVAPHILWWGYEFAPNSQGGYDVTFIQRFDVTSVLNELLAAVNDLHTDGCSHSHAYGAKITLLAQRQISAAASISGKKRACTDVFGVEWNTDVSDVSGSATGNLTFRTDPTLSSAPNSTLRFQGEFLANDPTGSYNIAADTILGINVSSVVGQIAVAINNIGLSAVAFVHQPSVESLFTTINIFNADVWRPPNFALDGVTFAIADNGVMSNVRYEKFLADMDGVAWGSQPFFLIDDDRTGFGGTPQAPVLQLAFVTSTNRAASIEQIKTDIEAEINILRSFGEDSRRVSVAPGDTLWKLARVYYGSPYFAYMLAAANGIARPAERALHPKAILTIPPLYELMIVPSVHYMAPGETIWDLCEKHPAVAKGECLKEFRVANPTLPLSHLYALEAVRVPDFH